MDWDSKGILGGKSRAIKTQVPLKCLVLTIRVRDCRRIDGDSDPPHPSTGRQPTDHDGAPVERKVRVDSTTGKLVRGEIKPVKDLLLP